MAAIGALLMLNVANGVLTYVANGATLADYFFEPPLSALSFLRPVGALLVIFGGLCVVFDKSRGGTLALIGSGFISLLGLIMAVAGADIGLWMDEILYGVAIAVIAVLSLTLRRPADRL